MPPILDHPDNTIDDEVEIQDNSNPPTNPLTHINAEGVLGEFQYSLEFPDSQAGRTIAIYAPNGDGKTTLFRTINAILTPTYENLEYLLSAPIRSITLTYTDHSVIKYTSATNAYTYSLQADFGDTDETVEISRADFTGPLAEDAMNDRAELKKYRATIARVNATASLIGDDRLHNYRTHPNRLRFGSQELSPRVRTDPLSVTFALSELAELFRTRALSGMSNSIADDSVYVKITRAILSSKSTAKSASETRQTLEHRLSTLITQGEPYEHYKLVSLDEARSILKAFDETRLNSRSFKNLGPTLNPYLESTEAHLGRLQPAFKLIDTFCTRLSSFLDRKEVIFSPDRGLGITRTLTNGRTRRINPESLSSGERHLLFIFSRAVLGANNHSLILIDEPEISLGLEWQRQLIRTLEECTEDSGCQFLIASHSTQVMRFLTDSSIFEPRIEPYDE